MKSTSIRRPIPTAMLALAASMPLAAASALAQQPGGSPSGSAAPDTPAASAATSQPAGQPTREASPADAVVAQRLVNAARLRARMSDDGAMQTAQALLSAAATLDPQDQTTLRLLSGVRLATGDVDGAIAPLVEYARADTTDVSAQIKLVELYTRRIQTVSGKLSYLNGLISKTAVPAEIRSYAAYLAARAQLERGDLDDARQMAENAVRLNPLNVDALLLSRSLLPADTGAYQRIMSLLAILRANPTLAEPAAALAMELSDLGLAQQSMLWFDVSLGLHQRLGIPPSSELILQYAAQLYQADQAQSAAQWVDRLNTVEPRNASAWFLRLTLDRAPGTPADQFDAHLNSARRALRATLADLGEIAAGNEPPERPADAAVAMPDVAATARQIVESGRLDLADAYVNALADLGWLELYFSRDARAASPLIDAMRLLLAEDSTLLARFEGWQSLVANQPEQAEVKLLAASERDPLATLGLVMLRRDPEHPHEAQAMARGLYSANPGGVMGAMFWQALRDGTDADASLFVPNKTAEAVLPEVQGFPTGLLSVIVAPQDLYVLRAEPLTVTSAYGVPMLARVTLQNLSNFDLTVGPSGIIGSDFAIDAEIRGLVQQKFPGVAVDSFGGPVVLRRGQSLSRVVRVDTGQLSSFLSANPNIALPVFGTVTTNPRLVTTPAAGPNAKEGDTETAVVPGPGGYSVRFVRLMERSSLPIHTEPLLGNLLNAASTGSAAERIRAMEALIVYTRVIGANPQAQANAPDPRRLVAPVAANADNPDPLLAAYARYLLGQVIAPDNRRTLAVEMIAAPRWETRLFALLISESLPPEQRMELARRVVDDTSGPVRDYARAIVGSPSGQSAEAP